MMSGNSPQHAHAQQGWNPHMYPQLPVTAQPNTGYQRSDPAVQPLAAAQQSERDHSDVSLCRTQGSYLLSYRHNQPNNTAPRLSGEHDLPALPSTNDNEN